MTMRIERKKGEHKKRKESEQRRDRDGGRREKEIRESGDKEET